MRRTNLKGHALIAEGEPHNGSGLRIGRWQSTGGSGHALCECGTLSELLDSVTQRQHWHREVHKAEVRVKEEQRDDDR
jgi:hypothetical protein